MCYQFKFLRNEVCAPTPPSCLHLHWVALTRSGQEINQMSANSWYLFFWGSGSFMPEVVNLRNQAGAKLFPDHSLLLKEGRLDRQKSCSSSPVKSSLLKPHAVMFHHIWGPEEHHVCGRTWDWLFFLTNVYVTLLAAYIFPRVPHFHICLENSVFSVTAIFVLTASPVWQP